VLDEPTNDLDIDSLELLETTLADYSGTLILVTHDRAFMDNVATQSLAAEGEGLWKEYAGGYTDWLAQSAFAAGAGAPAAKTDKRGSAPKEGVADPRSPRTGRQRLSYTEQRELDALPAQIESLEADQNELQSSMSSGDYHRRGGAQIQQDRVRLEQIEAALARSFERWAELEARKGAADQ
jgi:ATP-binding cassette subfamily F protein uup